MDKHYYSTPEVAVILNEPPSTIRYWCKVFEDFLDIEKQKNRKIFKDEDIENLQYIQTLLTINKYTVKQVIKYLEMGTLNFNNSTFTSKGKLLIEEFISKIDLMFKENLNNIKDEVLDHQDIKYIQLLDNQNEYNNKLLDSFSNTIKEQINPLLEQLNICQQHLETEHQEIEKLKNTVLELNTLILDINNTKSKRKKFFGI